MLKLEAHQQGAEVKRLHQHLGAEKSARENMQQRLNMQYLKSSLLVDMLVVRILESSGVKSNIVPLVALQQQHTTAEQQSIGQGTPMRPEQQDVDDLSSLEEF